MAEYDTPEEEVVAVLKMHNREICELWERVRALEGARVDDATDAIERGAAPMPEPKKKSAGPKNPEYVLAHNVLLTAVVNVLDNEHVALHGKTGDYCSSCSCDWPCDTRRHLDHYHQSVADLRARNVLD